MAPSNTVEEQRSESAAAGADSAMRQTRFLSIAFRVGVILLAVFQFSENTADPDLWGHVTYGQEMLQSHSIPKTEIYSWTSAGQPWINHEVISEICLGAAHSWLGGSGLLLLKMAI